MMSLLKFQKQERTKGRLAGQGQVNLMSGETLLFKTRVTCCEFKASELYIFCFIFKTIFNWCIIMPFNVTWNFTLLDLTTITENSYEGEWVWFDLRVLRSDATSTWHKEKIVSAKKEKKTCIFIATCVPVDEAILYNCIICIYVLDFPRYHFLVMWKYYGILFGMRISYNHVPVNCFEFSRDKI